VHNHQRLHIQKIITHEKMRLTQFIQRKNSTTRWRNEKNWRIGNEGKEDGDGPRLVVYLKATILRQESYHHGHPNNDQILTISSPHHVNISSMSN